MHVRTDNAHKSVKEIDCQNLRTTAVLIVRCNGFSDSGASVSTPVVKSFCCVINFNVKGSLGEGSLPWGPNSTPLSAGLKQPTQKKKYTN